MNVFITGATGFVGQEIVRQAHAAGHRLRILVRNPKSRSLEVIKNSCNPLVHVGDVSDPLSFEDAISKVEAVIHLVGIISEVGENTFENAHQRATENVLAAARRAGVPRFLHMSALGTRPGAASRYHQTKWQAEEAVRRSGLAFTIFRPSLIYGPHDHFVNLFAKMTRVSPVLPIMGSGRARFQPVAVEVVAAAFVRALGEPKSIGQTLDLCGPDTLTLPEILEEICVATGRKRPKISVPLPVARAQAVFLEGLYGKLLRKPPPLNRDQLIMLEEDNVGQGRVADELLGLEHGTFREGIGNYLGRDA